MGRRDRPAWTQADPATWRWRGGALTVLLLGVLALTGPLLVTLLARRLLRRRASLVGLSAKLSGDGPALPQGRVLVHGVSLGEVNLMRPLVPRLRALCGRDCLLTTTSETGWQGLASAFPDQARAFLPFDAPWAVERFLSRCKPAAVVLLEAELWPVLLCACHRRGIPVLLLNARVSARSLPRYRRAGALLRPLLAGIALVAAQNPLWGARALCLGVRRDRLLLTGSLKADMVQPAGPVQVAACAARLGIQPAVQPILLLASTSPGSGGAVDEETLFVAAAKALTQRGWRFAICPRHPERGAALATHLRAAGFAVQQSSMLTSPVPSTSAPRPASQALIIDEIGVLAGLYALTAHSGGIAVVGGSLGSGRGGQNMLEAAAAGCCTVVGFDVAAQPDGMALLRDAQAVVELVPRERAPGTLDPDAVTALLLALADDAARRAELATRAQQAFLRGRGAIDRLSAALAARGVLPQRDQR